MNPENAPPYPVDVIDRELMEILIDNARTPIEHISEQLNISPQEVDRRITKLEDMGMIKAYRAVVDPYIYSLYFFENGPLGARALAEKRAQTRRRRRR